MKELQLKIWWAVSLVMLWPMIRAVIVESTRLLTCRHSGNFLHLCCQGVLDAPRCVISLQFCYHQYSSLFIRVGFSISKRFKLINMTTGVLLHSDNSAKNLKKALTSQHYCSGILRYYYVTRWTLSLRVDGLLLPFISLWSTSGPPPTIEILGSFII